MKNNKKKRKKEKQTHYEFVLHKENIKIPKCPPKGQIALMCLKYYSLTRGKTKVYEGQIRKKQN